MQTRNYSTKKRGKTECMPLNDMQDIKHVIEWFENHNEWDGYLITMLGLSLGRRIGDTIAMKWCDLFYENGKMKDFIEIEEQKTGKFTRLPLTNIVKEVVDVYCDHTNTNPNDDYYNFIFKNVGKREWEKRKDDPIYKNITIDIWCEYLKKDYSEKRKSEVLIKFSKQKEYNTLGNYLYYKVEYNEILKWQADTYRQKLKKAIQDCNIKNPISTHSMRKTFGFWFQKLHEFDPESLLLLQDLFNHATVEQTKQYIGLSEEKKERYMEDLSDFYKNLLDGQYEEITKRMPVIPLKSDDFGRIIKSTIKDIQSGIDPIDVYEKAINSANQLRVC